MTKQNSYVAMLEQKKEKKKKKASSPKTNNVLASKSKNKIVEKANTAAKNYQQHKAVPEIKASKKSTNAKNAQRRISQRSSGKTSITNRTSRNSSTTSGIKSGIRQKNKEYQQRINNTHKINRQFDTLKSSLSTDAAKQKAKTSITKDLGLTNHTLPIQTVKNLQGNTSKSGAARGTNIITGKKAKTKSSDAGLQGTTPEAVKQQMKTKVGREAITKKADELNKQIRSSDNPRQTAYDIDKNPYLREVRTQAGFIRRQNEQQEEQKTGKNSYRYGYSPNKTKKNGSRYFDEELTKKGQEQRSQYEVKKATEQAEERQNLSEMHKLSPHNKATNDVATQMAKKTGVGETAGDWYEWEEKYPNWRYLKSVNGKAPEGTKAGDIVATGAGSYPVTHKNAQVNDTVRKYSTIHGERSKWNTDLPVSTETTKKDELPETMGGTGLRETLVKHYDDKEIKDLNKKFDANQETASVIEKFRQLDDEYGFSVRDEWRKSIGNVGRLSSETLQEQREGVAHYGGTLYSKYMTEDEQDTYRYLWVEEGANKANEYADNLKTELKRRKSEAEAKALQKAYDDEFETVHESTIVPVMEKVTDANGNQVQRWTGRYEAVQTTEDKEVYKGGWFGSALKSSVINGVVGLPGFVANAWKTATGQAITNNEWYNLTTKYSERLREGTINKIDSTLGKKAYTLATVGTDLAVQMGTAALASAVTGGAASEAGAVTLGNTVNNAGKLWKLASGAKSLAGKASLVSMAGGVAQQTFVDSYEKTGDAEKSLLNASVAGTLEYASERLFNPIEKLMSPTAPLTKGTVGKNILSAALGEAAEEGGTQLSQTFADYLILGDKSTYSETVGAYKKSGMSEEDAKKQAVKDLYLTGTVEAMVYGGIAGGIASGAANLRSYNTIKQTLKKDAYGDRYNYYKGLVASNTLSDEDLHTIIEPEIKSQYTYAQNNPETIAELTDHYVEKLRTNKTPTNPNSSIVKDIAQTVINSDMTDSSAIDTANKVLNHEVTDTTELMKMKKSLTEYSKQKAEDSKVELAEYTGYRTNAPETINLNGDGFAKAWINKSAEILDYINETDVVDTAVLAEYNKYSDMLLGGDVLNVNGQASVDVRRTVNNILYRYDGSAIGSKVSADDYEYRDTGTLSKIKNAVDERGDGSNVTIAKVTAIPKVSTSERVRYTDDTNTASFAVDLSGNLYVEYSRMNQLGTVITDSYVIPEFNRTAEDGTPEYSVADITDRLMSLTGDDVFIGQAFQMYMGSRSYEQNVRQTVGDTLVVGIGTKAPEGANFDVGVRYKSKLEDGTAVTVDVTNDSRVIHSRIRTSGNEWLYCDVWAVSQKMAPTDVQRAVKEQVGFDLPQLYKALNSYIFDNVPTEIFDSVEVKGGLDTTFETKEFSEEYDEMTADAPENILDVFRDATTAERKKYGKEKPDVTETYGDATVKIVRDGERTVIRYRTSPDEQYKMLIVEGGDLTEVTTDAYGRNHTKYPVGTIMTQLSKHTGEHIVPYIIGRYMNTNTHEGAGFDIEAEDRQNRRRNMETAAVEMLDRRESEKNRKALQQASREAAADNPFDGGEYLTDFVAKLISPRQKLTPFTKSLPQNNKPMFMLVPMGENAAGDSMTMVVPGIFKGGELMVYKDGVESENMGNPAEWQGMNDSVLWGYQTTQYNEEKAAAKMAEENRTKINEEIEAVNKAETAIEQTEEPTVEPKTATEYIRDVMSRYKVDSEELLNEVSNACLDEQYIIDLLVDGSTIEDAIITAYENGHTTYSNPSLHTVEEITTSEHVSDETPDNHRMVYVTDENGTTKWYTHQNSLWAYNEGEVENKTLDGETWQYANESNADTQMRDLTKRIADDGDADTAKYLRTAKGKDKLFGSKTKRDRNNSSQYNYNSAADQTIQTSEERTQMMAGRRDTFPRVISEQIESRKTKRKFNNIRELNDFITEKFGLKIKQNPEHLKHRIPNVEGVYMIEWDFVWTRTNSSYGTLSHEFGHSLDINNGFVDANSDVFKDFLNNMPTYRNYLSDLGYPNSHLMRELFADYMSAYLCEPDAAWQIGKYNEVDGGENFYNVFESLFSEEQLNNLHVIQSNLHNLLNNASASEKQASHMTSYAAETKRNRTKGWKKVVEVKNRLMYEYVRRTAPAERFDRMLEARRGATLSEDEKLSAAIELSGQHAIMAESWLKEGGATLRPKYGGVGYMADSNTETLFDILGDFDKEVTKNAKNKTRAKIMNTWYEDLNKYILAFHAIDREQMGQTTISDELAGGGEGDHIEYWQDVISEMTEKYGGSIEDTRMRILDWYNDVTKTFAVGVADQHGGYMLTEEMFKRWRTMYPNYVPMNRVHDGKSKKLFDRNSLKGSTRDIYNPIESMMLNVNKFVENYTKADVANTFMKFVNSNDSDIKYCLNQFVEIETAVDGVRSDEEYQDRLRQMIRDYAREHEIELDDETGEQTFLDLYTKARLEGEIVDKSRVVTDLQRAGNEDGRYRAYTPDGMVYTFTFTDKAFEQMMCGLDGRKRSVVAKAMAKLTRSFSAVTTSLNVMFALNNAVRDIQHGYINTEKRYSWDVFNLAYVPEYAKTLFQIVVQALPFKTDVKFETMEAINGHASRYYTHKDSISGHKYTHNGIKNLPILDFMKAGVAITEKINGAIENTPRYLAYNRAFDSAKKMGKTDEEASVIAAKAARESTVNFSNTGANMSNLSAVVPFIGASIAGIDQFRTLVFDKQTYRTKQGREKFARAIASQFFPALIVALAYRDDDEYNSFTNYYKSAYWLFKLPNGAWAKLPKDREYSALFTGLPQAVVDMICNPYLTTKEGMSEWMGYMLELMIPPNDLTLITPLIDTMNGKTWYDGDILSYNDETLFDGGADYYDQITDESTSTIANWIAEKMQLLPDGVLEKMGVLATPKGQDYILDQITGGIGDILLPLTTPSEGLSGTLSGILSKYSADPDKSNQYVSDAWDEYATVQADFELNGDKDWWEGSDEQKWYETLTTVMQSTSSSNKNPQFYTVGDYNKMVREALKDTSMTYKEREAFVAECRAHIADMTQKMMTDYKAGKLKDADEYCEVRVPDGAKDYGFSDDEYQEIYRDLIHGKGYETESKFAIVASNLSDEQKDFLSEHANVGPYVDYEEEISEAIANGITVDTFAEVRAQVKEKCNSKTTTANIAKYAATYEIVKNMGLSDKQISYFTDSIGTSDYSNVISAAFSNGYTADDVIKIVQTVKEEGLKKTADKQKRAAALAEDMGKDGTIAAALYSTMPKKTDAEEESESGDFVSPLADGTYYVSSSFGKRSVSVGSSNHGGVDLAAPSGTRIGSATSGTVIKSGKSGGYGNAVYVQMSDGRVVIYGHMKQASTLKAGDKVQQGDTIGYVGTTGTSSGNHLHLEIRSSDGTKIDPSTYYSYEKGGKTFVSKGTGGSEDTQDISSITSYLKLWADASKVATGETKKQKSIKSKISSTYKGEENKALRKRLYKWAEANYEKK